MVALVGLNGAGKTTLLNMAVGLAVPTAGTLTVLGGLPAGSPDALDRIAFVAQDAPLYKNLPVADMLHVARNLNRRWDHQRAQARLAELGIPLNKKVGHLSGGQKAQLALTVALARRPDLLVLDEPLASLDLLSQREIVKLLHGLHQGLGVTILLVSHDLNPVLNVISSAIYLLDGHAHYDTMNNMVDDALLSHIYGTPIEVAHTPLGELYMRSVL